MILVVTNNSFKGGDVTHTERRERDSGRLIEHTEVFFPAPRWWKIDRAHGGVLPCPEYGLPLIFSFQTPQHQLPPVCSINFSVKLMHPLYMFFIDSCGLVSDMAWRRRRCHALRFGDSYL
jgi:hypothetical protein